MISSVFCQFCQIINTKKQELLYENDQFAAFNDYDDATAQAHLLICTKEHIESAYHVKQASILYQMQRFAEEILTKLYKQRYNKDPQPQAFKFGFHVPPFISIFHIHLHAFILPFKNRSYNMIKYGYGPIFKSVDQISRQLAKRSSKL